MRYTKLEPIRNAALMILCALVVSTASESSSPTTVTADEVTAMPASVSYELIPATIIETAPAPKTDEEIVHDYFLEKGLNEYGVAGLMGNLFAESGMNPKNLQNEYEKSLGFSDESYIAAVDNESYTNFVRDGAAFGLAQWRYWSRKQGLLNLSAESDRSIGDLSLQLDFLWKELSEGYPSVLKTLQSAESVLEASNSFLFHFERPSDQGVGVQRIRAEYGQSYYNKFVVCPDHLAKH